MTKKLLPYLEALFAVIVWGASFIATKIAVGQISPTAVVWLRFAMGIPILLFAVVMRKQFAFPKGNEWWYFALLGFLGISFHQWLQSNGLKTAQATTTAWIVSTSPAFIAILGWLVLKEKLNLLQSLGIALAMVGVLAVVSKGDLSTLAVGKFGTYGDFLILISAVNWAVFSILSRRGLKNHPSTMMTFWVMTIGWLITSVAFFANKNYIDIPTTRFTRLDGDDLPRRLHHGSCLHCMVRRAQSIACRANRRVPFYRAADKHGGCRHYFE